MNQYVRLSWESIKHRKVRSWLTMLGIFVGIASIVALISLGQGMSNVVNEQFEMMGVDKIMIMPGQNLQSMGLAGEVLSEDDVEFIEKIKGVKLVAPMLYKTARLKYKDQMEFGFVIGLPTDESMDIIMSMGNFNIENGRKLEKKDKNKAMVGCRHTNGDLFDKKVRIGDKIYAEDQGYTVVGSMECIGSKPDDGQIYIPLDSARDLLNEQTKIDAMYVQVKDGFNPSEVAETIKKKMRKDRDLEKGEENFNIQTSEQLMESFGVILGVVQAVLIGIAAISLLVGGIGIMNIMYTSVLERTKEIGVMKAVGARNKDIMMIFLIESGMMGLGGGAIGVVIGIAIGKFIESIAAKTGYVFLKITFDPGLIIGALAFSFVVGALSGLLPARRAAKLKPVDALRY